MFCAIKAGQTASISKLKQITKRIKYKTTVVIRLTCDQIKTSKMFGKKYLEETMVSTKIPFEKNDVFAFFLNIFLSKSDIL